ncbi:mating-type protein MAT alpha 1-domain-containing protein [Achaetomium macrosporum]|uniref:Mating-type protein MAT alpha 1-domain-containing protein n=1 Tax=Achaetomium macrosporum TaxID=79813 RepID=A0AAN7HA53_9PEZI|nr:mating-type protein MAT alpha 1-domain-containing protein [Achaetomium macrosporum]
MSSINQIIRAFEGLPEGDRETAMKALSTMVGVVPAQQAAKKKVNGFMGYRAYYSSLFSQLTQKEKSPIMTALWKRDTFHKEWDFMCLVYSAIREFLSNENVSLQTWIDFAVRHLGIVVRDNYMATFGWELIQLEDGTHKVVRTHTRTVQSYLQPMNGLGLLMNCLNDGLPITDPVPIISKLSGQTNDIICINMQPGAVPQFTNTMEGFRQFATNHPQLAMSALWQVPATHPLITQGVTVHNLQDLPVPGAEDDDPELDAMIDQMFMEEYGPDHPYFTSRLTNGA